jgi:beta propeller repeat protein/parallel beta-helix repeat protein
VYSYESTTVINGSNISGTNYGINARGGRLTVTNSSVLDSETGIIATGSTLQLSENRFISNTATGVSVASSGGSISNNSFLGNGVGLALTGSNPAVERNTFLKNGIGTRILNAYPTLKNCSFEENGIGIKTEGAAIKLIDSNLANNTVGMDMNRDYTGDIIGTKDSYITFMRDGSREITLKLPDEHNLKNIRVDITGLQLGWVPIRDDKYIQRDADISGNTAVWADYRAGNYDVYMRDITADNNGNTVPDIFEMPFNNDDVQLTKAPGSQGIPAVSGHLIAWKDFNSDGTGRVILYSALNRTSWPITQPEDLSDIAIYGDTVAWSQNTGSNRDIFAYSLANGTVWQVTRTPDDEYQPQIWKDRMVWVEVRRRVAGRTTARPRVGRRDGRAGADSMRIAVIRDDPREAPGSLGIEEGKDREGNARRARGTHRGPRRSGNRRGAVSRCRSSR